MSGLEITLCIILALVCVVACIAGAYAYKFGVIILRIEDALEQSLDILDERYGSINKVLEIPLFADSVEIRQVHDDIKKSRETILDIANILTDGMLEQEE